MTTRTQREALRTQLLDTRRMTELAGEHPLMALAFREREQELEAKIEALKDDGEAEMPQYRPENPPSAFSYGCQTHTPDVRPADAQLAQMTKSVVL